MPMCSRMMVGNVTGRHCLSHENSIFYFFPMFDNGTFEFDAPRWKDFSRKKYVRSQRRLKSVWSIRKLENSSAGPRNEGPFASPRSGNLSSSSECISDFSGDDGGVNSDSWFDRPHPEHEYTDEWKPSCLLDEDNEDSANTDNSALKYSGHADASVLPNYDLSFVSPDRECDEKTALHCNSGGKKESPSMEDFSFISDNCSFICGDAGGSFYSLSPLSRNTEGPRGNGTHGQGSWLGSPGEDCLNGKHTQKDDPFNLGDANGNSVTAGGEPDLRHLGQTVESQNFEIQCGPRWTGSDDFDLSLSLSSPSSDEGCLLGEMEPAPLSKLMQAYLDKKRKNVPASGERTSSNRPLPVFPPKKPKLSSISAPMRNVARAHGAAVAPFAGEEIAKNAASKEADPETNNAGLNSRNNVSRKGPPIREKCKLNVTNSRNLLIKKKTNIRAEDLKVLLAEHNAKVRPRQKSSK